jgi:hypothetical protein
MKCTSGGSANALLMSGHQATYLAGTRCAAQQDVTSKARALGSNSQSTRNPEEKKEWVWHGMLVARDHICLNIRQDYFSQKLSLE